MSPSENFQFGEEGKRYQSVQIIRQRRPIGLYVPEERFVMPDEELDETHRAYRMNEREELLPLEPGPWR